MPTWGEICWGISDECGEEFSELMAIVSEGLEVEADHLPDPEALLKLAEFFEKWGLDDQVDEALYYAGELISLWEEITGYEFDENVMRWRDPETGRFVRDPYRDPDVVSSEDVRRWFEYY